MSSPFVTDAEGGDATDDAVNRLGGTKAMATKTTECSACERPLMEDQTLCVCGQPTEKMSFAERAAHEVMLWRAHREREVAR
jgi:hypothetical protein